jgi:predicted transcriptional regulator
MANRLKDTTKRTVPVTITFDPETLARLDELAELMGLSRGKVIKSLMDDQ